MVSGAIVIWIVIGVVIVGLVMLRVRKSLAARGAGRKPKHGGQRRGTVQGGVHAGGGGRSVAPRRDEPVIPEEVPSGDTDV